MFHSIRSKLFVSMVANIFIFIAILYFCNITFTENLYIGSKKNILLETSTEVKRILENITTEEILDNDVQYEINRIERNIGGSIFISTADANILYPLSQEIGGHLPPRSLSPFFAIENDKIVPFDNSDRFATMLLKDIHGLDIRTDRSFFMILEDPNLKIETLRYQSAPVDGLHLLIWLPMSALQDNVLVLNRLILITSVIVILITMLWIAYFSRKFTKPIVEMNKIAGNMAALDFTRTLVTNGNDEISQLGGSINQLSAKLDFTIKELNEKNQKLKEDIDKEKMIDQMRNQFISSVSHELKTPVFLIQGYAEGLMSNVADNPEKRKFYCEVINEEAEKLDKLITDLLEISILESGLFTVHLYDFDLSALVKNTVKKFEPVFSSKNIKRQLNVPRFCKVNADPVRIEQVLVNYINNALNHVDDQNQIKLSIEIVNGKARIGVYNSGPPIPEELIDKIWISFYKIDESRSREYGGTGQGLSIVKAIQNAHKNEFGVNNTDDGVEFWAMVDLKER